MYRHTDFRQFFLKFSRRGFSDSLKSLSCGTVDRVSLSENAIYGIMTGVMVIQPVVLKKADITPEGCLLAFISVFLFWLFDSGIEIEGIARNTRLDYKQSMDGRIDTIMNFIIEPYDKKMANITVEMHGGTFEGDISDGDIIKVKGEVKNNVIVVGKATNKTTNTTFHATGNGGSKGEIIIEGIARSVRISNETGPFGWGQLTVSILNFRIESTDKEGNILNFTPVQISGSVIIGDVVDGDKVKVRGVITHGLLWSKGMINITTNSLVKIYNQEVTKILSEQYNRVQGSMTVEGVARKSNRYNQMYIEKPNEQYRCYPVYYAILDFRIECYDKEGNIIKVVQVEIRGGKIYGDIMDGDIVKVTGKVIDGVLVTMQANNSTTNSLVFAR